MRGADTLIPARFLVLIGHLCVMITLLWESQASVNRCLPNQYHQRYSQIYLNRLVVGFGVSIALILIELMTFILGLTMFSPSVTLLSIGCHGIASVVLTVFLLDGWFCDWYWPVFAFCSVLPSLADSVTALFSLCLRTWLVKVCAVGSAKMTVKIIFQLFTTSEHQQLTQTHQYKAGWSFYLVLAGVATTFGSSLPVGYNIGVVNTPADVIKQFCNESLISRYDVVLDKSWLDVVWSWIVSIFIVGGCTGSILGAVLADKLGRKMATIVTSLLSIAGALNFLLSRWANSVEMLVLGRLLVGLSSGLTTSIVPMYLTELAPLPLTGALGVACPMGVNVGVLVGQVMGLNSILGGVDDWPYLLSVFALLVIICLPMLVILPESPKYLYVVKRKEETALKELSRLRGVSSSVLTEEVVSLGAEAGGAGGERWSMRRALADRRLRLPLLLACTMQAGQQTSGINAVFYYSQTIFRQAGLTALGAQYATIGCGFINVCTAAVMVWLLPRVGRRPLLLSSVLAAALLLAFLSAALLSMSVVPWMPYVCMVAVMAYVLVYGFGLGPIPYFIASEIFEVGPRPAGMAWGSLSNWAGNFLVGMTFPSLRAALGPYCFLLFAVATAALFAFQKFYFPETRGRTPTEVSQLCSQGFQSRPLARPDPN